MSYSGGFWKEVIKDNGRIIHREKLLGEMRGAFLVGRNTDM
jgi:hypothetical protein